MVRHEYFCKKNISIVNTLNGNILKVLGIIPAKGFSSGLKNKNKSLLNKQPLVSYVIRSAKKSKLLDTLIISTDSKNIKLIGEAYGVESPFTRPKNLSDGRAPLLAVVKHSYDYYKKKNIHFDAVMSIQPTNPFTSTDTIDKIIKLWENSGCDSITTVAEMTQGHPYTAKRLNDEMMVKSFCKIPKGAILAPRQKREKAYYPTGGIYLRDKSLLDQKISISKRHHFGKDHRAIVVNHYESIDINEKEDLQFAEYILGNMR